jgi:hypothetical protein
MTLKINFLPDSDLADYSAAIDEYKKLWKKEGEKIVKAIEKISNLKFQETEINAIVYFGILPSRSRPLCLTVKDSKERRLSILIHELGHRIISGNIRRRKTKSIPMDAHKLLDLILYDIWVELYGRKFADNAVEWEKRIPRAEYKEAWEWALYFNKEERAKRFKEALKKSEK